MPKVNGYRKNFRNRRFVRRQRQPVWKKMMGIGRQMYNEYRGPLGYALKGVNMLKNLVNTEAKFIDTVITTGGINASTGVIVPITLVAQGTTDITRIGNSILCKNVSCKMTAFMNTSASRTFIRYCMFIDKQNAQGTAPTVADLWQTADVNAMLNINNTDRFVVLSSGKVEMSITGEQAVNIDLFKGLSRLHIKYDGTAATQASAAEHHIYLIFISNEATNTPSVTGNARVTFYDN